MRRPRLDAPLLALFLAACDAGADDTTSTGATSSSSASTSSTTGVGGATSRPEVLTKLGGFLEGSFDNSAQVDAGFGCATRTSRG